MNKLSAIAFTVLVFGIGASAQSGSCLIVKHKSTLGRRLIWTAVIGIPIAPGAKYDYVDSVRFTGAKMNYKGKELESIQASGTRVIVLDKSTPEAITSARKSCETSTPAPSTSPSATATTTPAPTTASLRSSSPTGQQQQQSASASQESPSDNSQPAAAGNTFSDSGNDSLADAARRARQHKACLELAKDNPSIVCK